MSISKTKLFDLVEIVYHYLVGLDNHHLGPFLAGWPSKPFNSRMVSPCTLPILSYLPELVAEANTETETIIRMLVTLAEDLSWGQTYAPEDFGPAFLAKYGWTELIGWRGADCQ